MLAQAPEYADELRRQLAETGRARVWVPAMTPLAEVWSPGADLRAPRALPVLVIDGVDDTNFAAAIASLAHDLDDAEIFLTQQVPARMEPFAARTVALLNRGVPSFAVDSDGTLHTALMRSCTGWPSGVWIDEPRRTAPDGSNFQLQHWTHVFDYALVCDDGDWRAARIPVRSAQFSHPLLAVTPRLQRGTLPSIGSLLQVEPAGSVQLAALKVAGNPLVAGRAQRVDPGAVALRVVETTGADTPVAVRSGVGTLRARSSWPTCWSSRRNPRRRSTCTGIRWPPCWPGSKCPKCDAGQHELAPHAEAAQPLYARYWLHNRGPAPLGGLPAVAHVHPRSATAQPGDEVVLRITAASDCSDSVLDGVVTLVCPQGWSATPAELPFTLPSGEHLETDVVLTIPDRAEPGLYPVRTQLRLTDRGTPAAWRQVVEDVSVVTVGPAPKELVELVELLYLVDGPADVELRAGDSARLAVTVGTHARARLGAGGPPDQSMGNLGVDRSRRRSAPPCPPATRPNSSST